MKTILWPSAACLWCHCLFSLPLQCQYHLHWERHKHVCWNLQVCLISDAVVSWRLEWCYHYTVYSSLKLCLWTKLLELIVVTKFSLKPCTLGGLVFQEDQPASNDLSVKDWLTFFIEKMNFESIISSWVRLQMIGMKLCISLCFSFKYDWLFPFLNFCSAASTPCSTSSTNLSADLCPCDWVSCICTCKSTSCSVANISLICLDIAYSLYFLF